jgi:hypothetical protein
MLKHRDQIQAEVDSVTFIKHHRKENNIPQKYFWWFLDIFEYISDLPDPDYTALDDALKTPAPLKDRKRLCTTGDLFELFFKLDGIDLSDCDTKQIKENLIAIYVRIMNPCFTIEDIKRYRYKKSIPKSRFWWWLDLLIEPKYRHK